MIGSLRDRGIVGASRGLWSRIVFRRFRAGRILIADLDGGGVDALGSELRIRLLEFWKTSHIVFHIVCDVAWTNPFAER